MVQERKDARKSRISEPNDDQEAIEPSFLNHKIEGDMTQVSGLGERRNSHNSFGAFSNDLRNKAMTIKERQMEYAQQNVPKPKQRKKWK